MVTNVLGKTPKKIEDLSQEVLNKITSFGTIVQELNAKVENIEKNAKEVKTDPASPLATNTVSTGEIKPENLVELITTKVVKFLDEKVETIVKKIDKNKDGKLTQDEIVNMFATREFWGVVGLFLLPVGAALLSSFQGYWETGIWSWSLVAYVFFFISGPIAIAFMRKLFMATTKQKEMRLADREADLKKLDQDCQIDEQKAIGRLNINAQFIELFGDKNKLPIDVYFSKEQQKAVQMQQDKIKLWAEVEIQAANAKIESKSKVSAWEFWGVLVLLVMPIVYSVIAMVFAYWVTFEANPETAYWNTDYIEWALMFIIAPGGMVMLRKRFNVVANDLDKKAEDIEKQISKRQSDHLTFMAQITVAIDLQIHYIQYEIPKDKLPPSMVMDEQLAEEIKAQNTSVLAENAKLQTQVAALIKHIKGIDPDFLTTFIQF